MSSFSLFTTFHQMHQDHFCSASEPMNRLPDQAHVTEVMSTAAPVPKPFLTTQERIDLLMMAIDRSSTLSSPEARRTLLSTDGESRVGTPSSLAASPLSTFPTTSQFPNAPQPPSEFASPSHQLERHFVKLMQILEDNLNRGVPLSLRSAVSSQLSQTDVYASAGVNGWKEYAALAVKAGLIRLGGRSDKAWVELHPDWIGRVPQV